MWFKLMTAYSDSSGQRSDVIRPSIMMWFGQGFRWDPARHSGHIRPAVPVSSGQPHPAGCDHYLWEHVYSLPETCWKSHRRRLLFNAFTQNRSTYSVYAGCFGSSDWDYGFLPLTVPSKKYFVGSILSKRFSKIVLIIYSLHFAAVWSNIRSSVCSLKSVLWANAVNPTGNFGAKILNPADLPQFRQAEHWGRSIPFGIAASRRGCLPAESISVGSTLLKSFLNLFW